MHPFAVQVLRERSVRVGTWASRRLTTDAIERADLVLTAEAAHRRAVVLVQPRAVRRTFTLLQFARFASLATPLGDAALAGLEPEYLASVTAVRGELQPVAAEDDELADPIGRPLRAFRDCAITVAQAIEQILRPLSAP